VQFFSEKPARVSTPLHIETDANGEAQFSVPELTSKIDVLALAYKHWHCACWVMADTQTVTSQRHFANSTDHRLECTLPPANMEPGQIVFIAGSVERKGPIFTNRALLSEA
jgi:hypothetical protein